MAMMLSALAAAMLATVGAWNVGVITRDLSPSQAELATNRIYLGGYGALGFRGSNPGFARGVHDPVWARAFCIEDQRRNTMITLVIDTIGIGNVLIDTIRNRSATQTGLPRQNIMVSATHTHCGTDLQGLWGGTTPTYRQFVIDRSVDAIVEAYRTRQSADVFVSGRNPGPGYNGNRRGWPWTVNTTTVIDAFVRGTNRRIGTLLNFGAHPVTLGADELRVSSDFGHFLRIRFEQSSGAPLVWINGAIGDVSPGCPGCPGGGLPRAEAFGNRIAELALDVMRTRVPLDDELTIKAEQFNQPVSNVIFIAAFFSGILQGYYDFPFNGGDLFAITHITAFRLGRVGQNANSIDGVSLPGESLTRHSFPLQNAMTARFQLFYAALQFNRTKRTLLDLNKRQLAHQVLNLSLIVCSALMMWKGLIVVSGSESPIVVVLSGSMEPAFYRGDILFLWLGNEPFQVGEIVVFKVKGRDIPIVHRILEVHDKGNGDVEILTKGDNNPVDDRGLYNTGQLWLDKTDVLGRAKGFLPYIGMVTIQLTDHPMLKYLLVGIMGLFVITAKE